MNRAHLKHHLKKAFPYIALIAISWAAWELGVVFMAWFSSLDKEVGAAAVTALIGLIGILYIQWHTKAKAISDSHRPAKIEVYTIFFDIVEKFMEAAKKDDISLDPDDDNFPEDLRNQFTKLTRGMIIWASPEVIKAWGKFREHSVESRTPGEILKTVDDMLKAIRKDLGNSNFGLSSGDVVKLYISNPREVNID